MGLYRAAREGRIKDFTGIDSPYEAPLHAECEIDTQAMEMSDACRRLAGFFAQKTSNKARRIIRLQPPHKPTPTLC